MDEQCRVAESSLRTMGCTADLLAVKAGSTDTQHPALHANRPETPMIKDECVLQLDAFAMYTVTFSRMSRSLLTRASSARRRLIFICSGVTGLTSAPLSLPSMRLDPVEKGLVGRTQRAGCGSKRQAGINQSHGLKLEHEGLFNALCLGLSHVVSLRLLRHLARDMFFRGKVTSRIMIN